MVYGASVYYIRLCLLILCASYVSQAASTFWADSHSTISGNTTRYRRQTDDCKFKFQCDSGECVTEEVQCDGTENCRDGSDENNCGGIPCNRNFFKCEYGACINKQLVCDGKKDCKDNSDETNCKKPIVKPVTPAPTGKICGTSEIQCRSGHCIEDSLLCDGKSDCPDDSDETRERCFDFPCPRTTYKCRYGACVNRNAKCNGIKECFDGSDEASCTNIDKPTTDPTDKPIKPVTPPPVTPPPGPAPPGSCLMPSHPPKGEYTIGDTPVGTYKPGSYVSPFSALRAICQRNHKPSPPDRAVALCVNGAWLTEPATCSPACSPKNSSKTTKVSCAFKGRPLASCADAVEDTVASITCESLYEEPSIKQYPLRVCRDGTWDRHFPQCYPICGIKHPKGTPNIIGGQVAEIGDYPWHVGIYNSQSKQHLCGGSLLSQHIVLSAAHCFTDLSTGSKLPKENYLIAAGKYYRIYEDPRDAPLEQHRDIEEIYIPTRYKGDVSQYEGDLAVIKLKIKLELSKAVQPVCIDWHTESEYSTTSGNSLGVVVGWGQTVEGDKPSEELKELQLPIIPYDQCYEQVPKPFRRFLTHDKVCAGFLGNATAACQGDSGGGLTFPDNNDRYYIRGIVSTSPSTVDKHCDSNQYATYTLVSKHIEFIKLNGL